MYVLLFLIGGLGPVVPDGADLNTLTAGDTLLISLDDGEAWFRVLEDDYVCLRVPGSSGVRTSVFDDSGESLATGSEGEDVVISAFSHYWFYVRLRGRPGDTVRVSLEAVPCIRLSPRTEARGRLPLSEMGRCYDFVPPEEGRWQLVLSGGDRTDLDLEVYGEGMHRLGGGYSRSASEKVVFNAFPTDSLVFLVSRFNKAGRGSYALEVSRAGGVRRLEGNRSGLLDSENYIDRYLLPASESYRLVQLGSTSSGADIDLSLYDSEGEHLYSSAGSSSSEALLMGPEAGEIVVCVEAYNLDEQGQARYQLSTLTPPAAVDPVPLHRTIGLQPGRSGLTGCVCPDDGFYTVDCRFEKSRDGDVRFFRGEGDTSILSTTERGRETFTVWCSEGDTVWVAPYFADLADGGECTVSVERADPEPVTGSVSGEIGERSGRSHSYTVEADSGSIVVVRLSGRDRETDLDMTVSGKGFDITAEGYLSSVDAAGDESVSICAEEDLEFAVTVYAYERGAGTGYDLDVSRIESTTMEPDTPDPQIRALVVGISYYEAREDVLNRASMDACDFYSFLTEEQDVRPEQVALMVNGMATEEEFRNSFREILEVSGPEDLTVVFFSGHGMQYAPGTGGPEEADAANEALCLYDGDVEDDWLSATVEETARCPVILFVDACHSGGLVNDFEDGSDVLVVTAAREDRSVSERILTPILLRAARGDADYDHDGWVTSTELVKYVDLRLREICPMCDAVVEPGAVSCPECGTKLIGDNAIPRPEQGEYLSREIRLWRN
ncbi:hypothetical protein GF402_03435 [Candidatus Fermentibacteria bacterium]|nr:hypothetical protein [Candidatus Fermentibacteria bacterium]